MASIPDNLEDAKLLIRELERIVAERNREVEALRHRVDVLARRVFGRSSEKGVPEGQGALPFATAAGTVEENTSDEDRRDTEVKAHARRRHPGRKPLGKEHPREEIVIEPLAEELVCMACSTEKVCIGRDRTEALDYVPASFVIREYIRPKYACPDCRSGVVQGELPPRPIEKGRPEPGLLAHVVTSKYADHLPLYRLERIFERHQVEITRRTLSEWCGAVADLLEPVARAVYGQVLESAWIQTDDTPVEVQDPSHKPAYRNGHLWVYRSMEGDAVYDFTWQRNRDGPMRMLEGYRGYLQADAAPAYDDIFTQWPEIVEVGCWAHARRYFKEAAPTASVEAAQVLAWIGKLYGLERKAKERKLDAEVCRELREQQSRPILTKIRSNLGELQQRVLPKSPLGKAIGYALNQWDALCRYTEDGRLEIDNNGAERALRPIVVGRKNWLFIGSERAAHRTAVLLTLVHTAKAHDIDPFAYLRDLIERVSTHPMNRVDELTPRMWKELRRVRAAYAA